jgi:hypothetical protein
MRDVLAERGRCGASYETHRKSPEEARYDGAPAAALTNHSKEAYAALQQLLDAAQRS